MTRPLAASALALLCVFASPYAVATPPPPPADLSVTADFDRSPLDVGGRGALRFSITNKGPSRGYYMDATVKLTGALPLPASGELWSCAVQSTGMATCAIDRSLHVGETLTIEIPLIGQPGSLATADVHAGFHGSSADPDQANNRATLSAALRPTARQIDMAIGIDDDAGSALRFGPHVRKLSIENQGGRVANDVVVYLAERPDFTAAAGSPDWLCTTGTVIACTYARPIAAGRRAELLLEVRPPFTGAYEATATVAASGGVETDPYDNSTNFRESFGVASDFEPVLVPYLADFVRGAFDTIWTTSLAVYTTRPGVPLHGAPCSGPIELRVITNLWPVPGCRSESQGSLLYVAKADLETVAFSSHLFERGVLVGQLPLARGSEFKTILYLPRISIVASGVMARWTIRVYSIDAEPGDEVQADTWPRGFTFPPAPDPPLRRTFTRASEVRDEHGLPRYPAYAEYTHDDVVTLLARHRDPLTLQISSQRPIWAMLVLVDNETQRPVFLTPQ